MNPRENTQPQSNEESGRGASATHVSVSNTVSSISNSIKNMKVQDRVQAMNRVSEQEELIEPLEMIAGDEKTPKCYPKRSSVVEIWKKREGTIKKAPLSTTYNKFEEKKEVHSNEDQYVDLDVQRAQGKSGNSDQDGRQHDKMTAISTTLSATTCSSSHVVTPERSGGLESDDSNSNVGSVGSTSVRRSNIRDSWKKRAVPLVSTHTSQMVDLSLNASVTSVDNSISCSPVEESKPLNTDVVGSPVVNKTYSHSIPVTPSPAGRKGVDRGSWRKVEESKPQQTPETPHFKAPSPVGQSHSTFDELRSKWAKFGVQQEQAGAAGRAKPSMPLAGATQSPNFSSSHRVVRHVPKSLDTDQKEDGVSQSPSPSIKSWKRVVDQREEVQSKAEEDVDPYASPKVGDIGPVVVGDRKSHLVKMGQLHASRPKADVVSTPKSHTKRRTPSNYSPLLPDNALNDKTGTVTQPDTSLKRNALQNSGDAITLLRAKHRRRTQQAQSVSAAAVPKCRTNSVWASTHTTKFHVPPDDSFPIDEMDPDAFDNQPRNVKGDTMVRSAIPMRTLFGSQSGESLGLGPPNEKTIPYFPDQVQPTKTDVLKTTFDSWSEIESFSTESPQNAPDDPGSGNKAQPTNSSLTNSALKRLRERREKNYTQRADGSSKYKSPDVQQPITYEPDSCSPASQPASGNVIPYPTSPATSSTVSQNIGSYTSSSNSYVQATYTTGNSREITNKKNYVHSTLQDDVPDAYKMIPDNYASENNASVSSVRSAYENSRQEHTPSNTKDDASSLYGKFFPASPETSFAVSQSIGSDTSFSNSHMQSTYASGTTKESKKSSLHSTLKDVVPKATEMIPDEFVSEKNASVQSFRTAYENLSLEQIAKDMKDEASSALSIDFLSRELLNKSMHAAGASLNKLVAGEIFNTQKKDRRTLLHRATSPVEEVAIEVEYIGDDSEDEQ